MKWEYLLESDRELRAAARAYASEPSDENAHRLSQLYLRSSGISATPKRSGKKKVINLGRNQTEVRQTDGTVLLLSYGVPVAANLASGGFVRTKTNHSRTTQKHINSWLEGRKAKEVDQEFLDELL